MSDKNKFEDEKIENKRQRSMANVKKASEVDKAKNEVRISKLKDREIKEQIKTEKIIDKQNKKYSKPSKPSFSFKKVLSIFGKKNSEYDNERNLLENELKAIKDEERKMNLTFQDDFKKQKNDLIKKEKEFKQQIKEQQQDIQRKKQEEKEALKKNKLERKKEEIKKRQEIAANIKAKKLAIRREKVETLRLKSENASTPTNNFFLKFLNFFSKKTSNWNESKEKKNQLKEELLEEKLNNAKNKRKSEEKFAHLKSKFRKNKDANQKQITDLKKQLELKKGQEDVVEDSVKEVGSKVVKANPLKTKVMLKKFNKKEDQLFEKAESPGKEISKFSKFVHKGKIELFKKIKKEEMVSIKSIIASLLVWADQDDIEKQVDILYKTQVVYILSGRNVKIGDLSLSRAKYKGFNDIAVKRRAVEQAFSIFDSELEKEYTRIITEKLDSGATIMLANGLGIKLENDKSFIMQDTNITGA